MIVANQRKCICTFICTHIIAHIFAHYSIQKPQKPETGGGGGKPETGGVLD